MRTLLRLERSRAYSSKTSCSRGVHAGAVEEVVLGSAIAPGRKDSYGESRDSLTAVIAST